MKKKVVTQISLFEFSCCCCCCWALVCNTQQGYINDVVSRLLSRRFNFLCVVDLPIEKYGKIEKNFHGKQEEESARLEGVTQHLWERYIYWKAAEESDQQQVTQKIQPLFFLLFFFFFPPLDQSGSLRNERRLHLHIPETGIFIVKFFFTRIFRKYISCWCWFI